MKEELFQEILLARQRVYAVGEPTPLEHVSLPIDAEVYLKREDLSAIHAYKWRGAYNRMAMLSAEEREAGVICASAGNHAQGVAIAAQKLGVNARIYMPCSTPLMKQLAVQQHGGDRVDIILHGDNYTEAAELALSDLEKSDSTFIHPFDDLGTMGGQGTLADEIVMSGEGPFDVAYLQIGGGGMASAVACWLKKHYPDIRIVGVEEVDQACMKAAIEAGGPVTLDYVDVFCDGTAVKRAGDLTYQLCSELVDEFITVTNEEVCAAIQMLWEANRCIPEPAGALGLAGLLKQQDQVTGQKVLCVVCGSNLDFGQLGWIAQHAGIGGGRRRYMRFEIGEYTGGMLDLINSALDGVNIIEFQYGKVDNEKAWPVIGFEASPMELQLLDQRLTDLAIPHEDVTSQEDVEFRIIHYESSLFNNPYFITLEFPERAGALHDFLALFKGNANMCYFNYAYTGEQVGRALLGFEFDSLDAQVSFKQILADSHLTHHEISAEVISRVL
jgi:threonine dehydratase